MSLLVGAGFVLNAIFPLECFSNMAGWMKFCHKR